VSAQQLAEIEARLKAATPGPWEAATTARSVYGTPIHGPFGSRGRPDEGPHIANAFSDAEFIAHAPADVTVLVEAVKALAALKDYSRHRAGCANPGWPCDCGYSDVARRAAAVLGTFDHQGGERPAP
jgi:hypothetical protein